jgi:hypothetical protein
MDIFSFAELALAGTVVAVLMFLLLSNFSVQIGGMDTPTNYSGFVDTANVRTTRSVDFAIFAFLLIALIFSVIMARRLPTEPLYIGIILLLSFVFFIISFVISNVFTKIAETPEFTDIILQYMPLTNFIFKYFPFVTAIYIGIVMVVFFAKQE